MNISLPGPMKAFVDEQVRKGSFGTASEYIRQLLREEQRRQLQEQIDARLLHALDSGEPIDVSAEYWEQKRQQLMQRRTGNGPAS